MESTEAGGSTTVVALVADLLFASRVRGAAALVGVEAVTVTGADRLMEEVRHRRPRLVLVDLEVRRVDVPALIVRLKGTTETAAVTVVAFGSHLNAGALKAAREAGADRVLARSAFVRDLPELLRG